MFAFSEEVNVTSSLSHFSVQVKSTNIMILLTSPYPFMRISNYISRTRDYSSLLNIYLVVHFTKTHEVLLLEYLYVFKICLLLLQ